MHVDLAVVADQKQPVHGNRAGGVSTQPDANAGDLGAVAFAVTRLALFPFEELRAEVERFAQVTAGEERTARHGRRRCRRDRLLTGHLSRGLLSGTGGPSLFSRL